MIASAAEAAEMDGDTRARAGRPALLPSGLTGLDTLVVCVAFVYAIAWVPRLVSPELARLVLLICVAPVAGWLLVVAARRRDRASLALCALLSVLLLSGLLSPGPLMSVRGDIGSWMSVVAYLLAAAWWVLGRTVGPIGRAVVPIAVTCGLAVNALVGLAQVGLKVRTGPLASLPGRASGLMQNPVYYGSFAVGVCAYWIMRAVVGRRWTTWAAVFGTALAAGLSGSRIVLVVAMIVALVAMAVRRTWSGLVAPVVTLLGFAAAALFTRATSSVSAVDRLAGGESVDSRMQIWRHGLGAFLDRPLLGWGPNHFGTATYDRISADYVRDFAYDDAVQSWADPHNIVILLLVTAGGAGLVVCVAFVALATRGTIDPGLLAAAGAIACTWLLQPATVHSLPIALLFLGMAVRPRSGDDSNGSRCTSSAAGADREPSVPRAALLVALLLGVVAGGLLAVAMFRIDMAARDGDMAALERRAAPFGSDPYVQSYVALRLEGAALREEAVDRQGHITGAIEAARRAATTFPSPGRWNRVAELHLLAGHPAAARAATEQALELQSWNPTAHRRLYLIARLTDDDELRERAEANVCLLGLDVCPTSTG